jgi:PAS domain S-box-containing protein
MEQPARILLVASDSPRESAAGTSRESAAGQGSHADTRASTAPRKNAPSDRAGWAESALAKAGFQPLSISLHEPERAEALLLELRSGTAGPPPRALIAAIDESQTEMLRALLARPGFAELPLLLAIEGDTGRVFALARALGAEGVCSDFNELELEARLTRMLRDRDMRSELARKERDAQLALELTRALSSSLDFREILYTVVRRIAEVVHVDRVSIVVTPEDEPKSGYVVAASDDQALSDLRLDLGKYPEIERVLTTKDVLIINDVANHPLLDGVRDSVPHLSALCLIPICWQDRVIGVLFLRALDGQKLQKEQLDVCLIVANATGSALRNAHLMQKLRRDHREAQVAQSKAVERAEYERVVSSELRKTKEFLESLIEASVDAIVAADLTGTIILYNKGAERIYGRTADEVVGRLHVDKLYPDGVAREVMRRIRSADYGGVGRLESMHSAAIDKEGNAIPISLSAAMIYEHGKPTATVGIFTDLREKIQAEERLAQVQKKLEVSEKQALLAELAGTAAHELNQPLTSVMGYGELLIRRLPAGTPERNAAQVIMQEAERMANLVRRIGKITRYETKSYVGDQRILDLDRATDDGPDNNR